MEQPEQRRQTLRVARSPGQSHRARLSAEASTDWSCAVNLPVQKRSRAPPNQTRGAEADSVFPNLS
jgi:hypothetical protein